MHVPGSCTGHCRTHICFVPHVSTHIPTSHVHTTPPPTSQHTCMLCVCPVSPLLCLWAHDRVSSLPTHTIHTNLCISPATHTPACFAYALQLLCCPYRHAALLPALNLTLRVTVTCIVRPRYVIRDLGQGAGRGGVMSHQQSLSAAA
jgi:hypothetical protein